jgi:hypothetical protein
MLEARGERPPADSRPVAKVDGPKKFVAPAIARNRESNHEAARFVGLQLHLADLAKKWAIPFAASALFEQFRMADYIAPQGLRMAELAGTARIAEIVSAQSALSGWRQSLVTEQAATTIAASSLAKFTSLGAAGVLADLTRFTNLGASLSETALKLSSAEMFTSVLSQPPVLSLRRYVTALPRSPSLHQITMGARASHGVAGLVAIDVATSASDDQGELEKAFGQIENEIIEPWMNGPTAAREEMIRRLREIDESVPDLLAGAWDDLNRDGPGAEVKVATCATEALERTLRGLAPDVDVLAWLSDQNHSSQDLDSHGGPTYATRARYILRERSGDRKLVRTQITAVIAQVPELRSRLQAGKHASEGTLVALKAHLVSTEAILVQLTLMM